MKNFSIKTLVAIGIGAAIFAVLARYVSIPTPIPSTTLTIQYAILALFALLYGPWAGLLIGFIGHTVSDMMGGSPWWSWIAASAVAGLLIKKDGFYEQSGFRRADYRVSEFFISV